MKSNDPSKKEAALSGRFLFHCLLLFVFQSPFQPFASQAAGCYRSDPGAFPQTAIPSVCFIALRFFPFHSRFSFCNQKCKYQTHDKNWPQKSCLSNKIEVSLFIMHCAKCHPKGNGHKRSARINAKDYIFHIIPPLPLPAAIQARLPDHRTAHPLPCWQSHGWQRSTDPGRSQRPSCPSW